MDREVLHHHAILGNYFQVQYLVNEGVDINCKDSLGQTPLILAAQYSRTEVVQFLINSGADIHCCDVDGMTALHYASYGGSVEMVHCLVYEGVAIDVKDIDGRTSLMLAAHFSHREVFELLMKLGADIHCCDEKGMTVLHYASYGVVGSVEIVHLLVNIGVAIDKKNADGRTPLMFAAHWSRKEVTELLVNSGADIHCRDNNGFTAFHHACTSGSVDVVKYLVNYKGTSDAKDIKGDTPLMMAAHSSRELVELLINLGADIHCCDNYGRTVLHHALSASDNARDQGGIVQLLLQKRVDINARCFSGCTPLHYAFLFGQIEIAAHLLKAGADCNLESNKGLTPFSFLIRKDKHLETIKLCIEKGVVVKSTDFKILLKDPLLKKVVLQDVKLCSQAVINKFDNKELPFFYKRLASAQRFPHIDVMKIADGSRTALEVEKAVSHEIKAKGFCNLIDTVPLVLSILCVKSFIEKS